MKAVLVMTSFVTRVIVSDGATEEQIINVAKQKHRNNIELDFGSCIEEIMPDEEVPYNPETDGTPISSIADVFSLFHQNKNPV